MKLIEFLYLALPPLGGSHKYYKGSPFLPFLLLPATKCPFQVGEGTRSRASNSPLWSLVRLLSQFKEDLARPDPFCSKGASGTGRTTFVNTLCEADVLAHKESEPPESAHMEQRIKIKPATVGKYCEDLLFRYYSSL